MERSYGVITTVINLHDAQSITKDSARLCPHTHTLCLCMTPRALWWLLPWGWGVGGQHRHPLWLSEALLRGLACQEPGVAQTHAWQQHREDRGQKQRLKGCSLGARGGRNKKQSKLGEQRRFSCEPVGWWAFIVISQHHQIFIIFTSKTVC